MSANHHLKPGKNGYFTQPSSSKPEPCSQDRQSLRMEKPSLPPPPPHRNTGCNNCYTLPSNDPRVRTASIHRTTNNTLPRSFNTQEHVVTTNQQFTKKVHHAQHQYPPGKCEIDVRLRSFSQNGMMIRNGRPRSDCFVASEAHKSFSYSQADTAMESSLTSSPSSEPLIPDKGWLKEKKTVVFVNLSRENSLFSSSSSSELFTQGKVWDNQKQARHFHDHNFWEEKCLPRKKFHISDAVGFGGPSHGFCTKNFMFWTCECDKDSLRGACMSLYGHINLNNQDVRKTKWK